MILDTPIIDRFDGTQYRFLSNFYAFPIEYKGKMFPTSEHAYQAVKMAEEDDFEVVRTAFTPADAKKLGNSLPIRSDWNEVKIELMEEILRAKFSYPLMGERLLKTGNAHLEEGNTWGDKFWGTVKGVGENCLGKLLMKIRKELEDESNTTTG